MWKRRVLNMLLAFFLIMTLLLFYTVAALRAFQPDDQTELRTSLREEIQYNHGDVITLLTWNLGYAGLGEESAFFFESKRIRDILPPSKEIARKNMDGVLSYLLNNPADVILLQEVTTSSIMNYNILMCDEIAEELTGLNSAFSERVRIRLPILSMIHGNAIYSNFKPISMFRYSLPLETKGWTGFFNQKYNFMVARYEIQDIPYELVILNTHFAAFDEGGTIREKQLDRIIQFIEAEYEKGNYVVAGGDWNLMLEETDFPYDSPEEFLTWKQALRDDVHTKLAAAGWSIPVDSTTPTVRSLEKLYDGKNFTTIIDGFICSPNLEVVEVESANMGFKFSDHNPVLLHFRPLN